MLQDLSPTARQLTETFSVFRETIAGFPPGALDRQFGGRSQSVTDIVSHVVAAQHRYDSLIRKTSDSPPSVPTLPSPATNLALCGALDLAVEEALACLEAVTPDTLHDPLAYTWGDWVADSSGNPLDARWFAGQMLRHAAYHLGQVNVYALMLASEG